MFNHSKLRSNPAKPKINQIEQYFIDRSPRVVQKIIKYKQRHSLSYEKDIVVPYTRLSPTKEFARKVTKLRKQERAFKDSVRSQGIIPTDFKLGLDEEAREAVDDVINALKDINVKISTSPDLKEQINETISETKNAKSIFAQAYNQVGVWFEDIVQFLIGMAAISYGSYRISLGHSKWWAALITYGVMLLGTFLGKFGLFGEELKEMILKDAGKVSPFRNSDGAPIDEIPVAPQAFNPSGLAKPIALFMCMFTTGTRPIEKELESFVNRFSRAAPAKEGIESMFSWVTDMFRRGSSIRPKLRNGYFFGNNLW